MTKRCLFLLFICCLFGGFIHGNENDFLKPIGRPKEAKAQRRQGGESFPPLPLPATPLRRSEKKRPPSPTILIGKVIWGSYLDYTYPDGRIQRLFDWDMVPADCQMLLRVLKLTTHLEYTTRSIDLDSFSGDPREIPILHISGGRTPRFSASQRLKLRSYLINGGTIWFDSIVGSPYFLSGARQEAQSLLPESPLRRISADHALYRMLWDSAQAQDNSGQTALPEFEGIYVGSRIAVVIAPCGLGTGWDDLTPEIITQARYYKTASARSLGMNLAMYALGWFESGQSFAAGTVLESSLIKSADRITFALLKTNGLWNCDPGAVPRLMSYVSRNCSIDAGTEPAIVDINSMPLERYPFLYLSGIGAFSFDNQAIIKLRGYLDNGGFLIANNTLGMNDFDISFRGLVQRLYPERKLEVLSSEHPLFSKGPFRFSGSGFTDAAKEKYLGRVTPLLYVMEEQGRLPILYSPVDMAGGWLSVSRPASVCYTSSTALRLGASIITYVVTH